MLPHLDMNVIVSLLGGMQIGKPKAGKSAREIRIDLSGVGLDHIVELDARRDFEPRARGPDSLGDASGHLKQETAAIFHCAAIPVVTKIDRGVEELVNEIAGRCMNFNAVKSSRHSAFGRACELGRDAGNFLGLKGSRNNEILLAVISLVLALDRDG